MERRGDCCGPGSRNHRSQELCKQGHLCSAPEATSHWSGRAWQGRLWSPRWGQHTATARTRAQTTPSLCHRAVMPQERKGGGRAVVLEPRS